jgi:ribosomal-protein-alanine N-acetyltransferase
MSAVLKPLPWFEPMREADIDAVVEIEQRIYDFPWTAGNFLDSMRAGYSCWVHRDSECIIGYAVLMLAADEAHLLNLSIDAAFQRRGHGGRLLQHLMYFARGLHVKQFFLEARPSNAVGNALYAKCGFRQLAVRPGYYPAHDGREDALLLVREL